VSDFVLNIPDEVIAAARQIAEATAQPVEDVLLNRLKTVLPALPPDEEAELEALHHLSDDALWTIAHERMQDLMDKNSLGTISPEEYAELEQLVDRGQRLTLRKSEAAAILTRRGYRFHNRV
jgi:CHAD domain-containing protein